MTNLSISIDIIILSYAKTPYLKSLTEQTIQTLLSSEDQEKIKFEIIVIESEKKLVPFQFANTKTIYPKEKFGFNKYLNIGLSLTNNKYVCLCNNDLIFYPNWASEIILAMERDNNLMCATPYCPDHHASKAFEANSQPLEGYHGVFTGWCFLVKREIFDQIGVLDEKLLFWYSDNDFLQLLLKHKLKNALISTAFVKHLGSESLKDTNKNTFNKLTRLPQIYYNYKWNHHSFLRYQLEKALFTFRNLLA